MPRSTDRAAQYRARRQLLRMARGLVKQAFADSPQSSAPSPVLASPAAVGGDGASLVPAASVRTDLLRQFVRRHPSAAAATLATWIAPTKGNDQNESAND
ncbi:MAG: hypothetical protein HYS13_03390 [Planctomycetia bacterium]|nr:hypothetical protein [Planctomycetia bacterium]